MGKIIRISVRDLVEFLMRAGDLDERYAGAPEEAMLEGARMHRKLQREAGPDYTAEVPLSIYYPIVLPSSDLASAEDKAVSDSDDTAPAGDETALTGIEACVLVEGRADGIFCGVDPESPIFGEAWTIDEIKTTYRKVSKMKEPEPVHLAQAKCYAYIYCMQNRLDIVRVRMTYCSLVTQEIRRFTQEFTAEEISEWFGGLMDEYSRWAGMVIRWEMVRNRSLSALEFPFRYREGQRELVVHVYHTICHKRKLFLEAPTGTGKTISTVFPALKAIGEGKADRLFYFTAKTVTGQVAMETLSILRGKGMRLKSIQLTAKDKICPFKRNADRSDDALKEQSAYSFDDAMKEQPAGSSERSRKEKPGCNPDECPRARGHYDRINEALFAILTQEEDIRRETLEAYGEKYNVCPFELGLDVSTFADAMVGDYNYLFDPHARLKRFFAEGKGGDRYLFLVDEAHNLVDRGRDMFSASLSREEMKSFRSAVREVYPSLWKKLGKLIAAFRPYKEAFEAEGAENGAEGTPNTRTVTAEPGINETMTGMRSSFMEVMGGRERVLLTEEIDAAADAVSKVMEEMQFILQEQRRGTGRADAAAAQVREGFMNALFALNHFLTIYEGMEGDYQIYAQKFGREEVKLQLFCVDPSGKLAQCLEKGEASVLFSATFLPIRYYKRLLGGTEEDYEVYAKSSFDPGRLGLFIAGDVTSRYRSRGTDQYVKIAAGIHSAVSERHGNYMIFFPSYRFMEQVLEQYVTMFPEDEETSFSVQRPQMTEEERTQFLERFEEASDDKSLLGFCVLGGIFSEGIDLRQDRLIGAVIVGTGFPQVCAQREILKVYFDGRGENGFDYAYRYPGMNKVLQAAGRVIRTADDVGVVVLMDERFCTGAYRRLFPAQWSGGRVTDSREIGDKIAVFWNEWL